MTLLVRFLGSGDAFGSGGRLQACILLERRASRAQGPLPPGYKALLDCGASSLPALRRAGVEPNDIDAILLSHFHGDHYGGVAFLLLDAYYGGRTRPLVVAGPPGVEERVRESSDALFRGFAPRRLRYELSFLPLDERTATQIGPLAVTGVSVPHVPDVTPMGLRVAVDGKTVAYSGDAAWSAKLAELARGADLFICEASSFEPSGAVHVSYRELTEHRAELGCDRIVLTHLGRDVLARLAEVELECAYDGMTLEL